MRLSEKALHAINNKSTRLKIATALDLTEQSIIRLIKDNSDSLTKAASMAVIREETSLSEEQILQSNTISELDVNEG